MTNNIRLVNEDLLNDREMLILSRAVDHFLPQINTGWSVDSKQVHAPTDKEWKVVISDAKRHQGAAGYHTVENGNPIAYCSPKASGRLFGTYHPPFVLRGKTLSGERFLPGLITTICHELAEMLMDPVVTNFSPKDAKGRSWLIEVADPVAFSYLHWTDPVTQTICVLPDVVLPPFYDLQGKAPFSLRQSISAPFTLAPRGYAYWRDDKGLLHPVT